MHFRQHKHSFIFIATLGMLLLSNQFSKAQLLWYGDPDKGTAVFDNLNYEGAIRYSSGSGTILPASDPVYGKIWQVCKPAPDKRGEIRGAKGFSNHGGTGGVIKEGETYYLGWRYKFDMPEKETGGWACFQWKSYPDPNNPESFTQNYPFTMGYNGHNLTLTKHGSGWDKDRSKVVQVWSKPVKINTWVDIVLVVKVSSNENVGYIEIYFDGEKQELITGDTRVYHKTMDGLEVAPKWGAYNKNTVGTEITVNLADMRIGRDLESVMPKPVR